MLKMSNANFVAPSDVVLGSNPSPRQREFGVWGAFAVPTDETLGGETPECSAEPLHALSSFYGIESIDEPPEGLKDAQSPENLNDEVTEWSRDIEKPLNEADKTPSEL